MRPRFRKLWLAVACMVLSGSAEAQDTSAESLQSQFASQVHPFLNTYCVSCHGADKPDGQFDLTTYSSLSAIEKDERRWSRVLDRLKNNQMPPKDADALPSARERQEAVKWFASFRNYQMHLHAGDPGIVLARRLSNSEYNYTVRDLTGFDIQPTKEFPADPTNTAGFDNSGETLVMSKELLNKYLKAAHDVADHMFLKPDGFDFSPYPMLVETDQDKYCVTHILELYHSVDIDYAHYFQAAWRYKHRAALNRPAASLADFADGKLSAKYLATVWPMLEEEKGAVGPLARLQGMWHALPDADEDDAVSQGCRAMSDYLIGFRKKVELRFLNLAVNRSQGAASAPQVIWKNVQYATHRRSYDATQLQVDGDPLTPVLDVSNEPNAASPYGPGRTVPVINQPGDSDLYVPAGQRAKYETAFARFCSVFPDRFYTEERGRSYFNTTEDRGRFLSAGFHSSMGYFRDDQPLCELMLDEKRLKALNDLWVLFDYMAHATERLYLENGARRGANTLPQQAAASTTAPTTQLALEPLATAEDRVDFTAEATIEKTESRYLAIAADETVRQAGRTYYSWVNDTLRSMEKLRVESEPKHLDALLTFAARAYRRPLSPGEKADLLNCYSTLCQQDGLDHPAAMRELIVAVLISPDTTYRIDLAQSSHAVQPLTDYELASRLSYFLWSSLPDEELLAHAAAGDLHQTEVITQQTRRMLKDPRTEALAMEFGANWLDIRRFQELNTVDRERFASFTPELRDAMFEEPARLMLEVFQKNGSILDLIYGDYTFANRVLAKHYGFPISDLKKDQWVRFDNAGQFGRGGLLPMAVFLTKNAPGLRTSPVKRGNWVVKNILGERIPPPPAVVPELPKDEAKADLPLRAMLASHRADVNCAACHDRFDSMGLVFEGFGPVGERRRFDLAGRSIDDSATFPGGFEGTGLAGLQNYIRNSRQNDFVNNFCGKLLAYGLGRSLMLSDDLLIEEMNRKLAADNYRFDKLVESIVTSPQFLNKRGREDLAER